MDFQTLKVSELKQLLKDNNLSQIGLKAELVARLQEFYNNSQQKVDMNGGDQIVIQQVPVVETIIEPTKVEEPIPQKVVENAAPSTLKRPLESETTEEERKKFRAQKFGITVESVKIAKRAERFGTGEVADKASLEKIKNRAERFGVVSPIVQSVEEKNRIEKRKERFGNVKENDTTTSISSDSAIAKRQNRFGVVEPEKIKTKTNTNNRQFHNNRQFNNRRRF